MPNRQVLLLRASSCHPHTANDKIHNDLPPLTGLHLPQHDVLVIGAGLAGMRAAIEAHRHTVPTSPLSPRSHPVRSHSNAAQGGINAAMPEEGREDDWESHAFDTVKGSDYLGDQDAIEIMAREAPSDIIELEHMGVIFNRDERGRLGARSFGGASFARTFFVADITGQAILHVMYEQLMKAGIFVYEEWFVTSLIMIDGACRGAVAMDMLSGRIEPIQAKAVIMASGGLGRVYEPSTNAMICTGDGIALAYNAGAPPPGHGDGPVPPHHPPRQRCPPLRGC